jgi:hypothetical protein
MPIRVRRGVALSLVVFSLFGVVLGCAAARILFFQDVAAGRWQITRVEFQRHCADLQQRLDEATAKLNEFRRLHRKIDERVGLPAPELNVQGWLNDPLQTVERLNGKVVVLDVWAYW